MAIGKTLIIAGLCLIGVGLLILYQGKIPFLGRLPGDIRIETERFTLYIPLTSCLLISLMVSLLIRLFRR